MSLELVVAIVGSASALGSELDKAGGQVTAFGKTLDVGGIAKVGALAGVAGVAAGAIVGMTNAAAEDAAEQARLEQAVAAAGAATATSTAQMDAAIAAGQAKAFSDTEQREALQSLVTATGSVDAATVQLTAAQDIARLAGVDLATAADAVAKANAGQDGALRKLIPGLAKGASATDTIAEATALAAGQADIYASSAKGATETAAMGFGELGEEIGAAFLPIMAELMPALMPLIKALGELIRAILPAIIPLLQLVAKVFVAIATAISKVVSWLASFISKIRDALGAVGRFLDSINPLKGISLPFMASAPVAPATFGRSITGLAAPRAGSGGGVTVNVYGGNPAAVERAVIRAVQRFGRLNGPNAMTAPWTR